MWLIGRFRFGCWCQLSFSLALANYFLPLPRVLSTLSTAQFPAAAKTLGKCAFEAHLKFAYTFLYKWLLPSSSSFRCFSACSFPPKSMFYCSDAELLWMFQSFLWFEQFVLLSFHLLGLAGTLLSMWQSCRALRFSGGSLWGRLRFFLGLFRVE